MSEHDKNKIEQLFEELEKLKQNEKVKKAIKVIGYIVTIGKLVMAVVHYIRTCDTTTIK